MTPILTVARDDAAIDLAEYLCKMDCPTERSGPDSFVANCQYNCENGVTGNYSLSYSDEKTPSFVDLGPLDRAQPRGCKLNNISFPTFVPAIDLP